MPSNYRAIHFDMDGVLANTEPTHVAAEQQACRDFNFAIDPGHWGGFKGRTAEDIFTYLIENYGDPAVHTVQDLIAHKTDIFIEQLRGKVAPIEGSLDFLLWARKAHQYVTLVTSSNRRVQRFITESFGITEVFDAIVNGDDISEGKPSPQPYLKALGRLGLDGTESVIIEDSTSGIVSGLAAGCHVLAITTSHTSTELAKVKPTYIAEDYKLARSALST